MNHFKKTASAVLVLVVVAGGAFFAAPKSAHAFWPVIDPTNLVQNTLVAIHAVTGCSIKVCVLDPIAWSVAKVLSQQLTGSIVHWVNRGFNGGPAFITNLPRYLGNVSDNSAAQYFSALSSSPLNSPFQDQISQALQVEYQRATAPNAFVLQNQNTLPSGYVDSSGDYDFRRGGVSGWSLFTQAQNNPLGLYLLTEDSLTSHLQNSAYQARTEANWGNGFLSYRGRGSDCITPAYSSGSGDCLGGNIQTPAQTIRATLDKALGSGFDSLTAAHSIGEIISSLVTDLLQSTLSQGLSGLSESRSGSGSLDERLQTSTSLGSGASSANAAGLSDALSQQINQATQFQDNWQTILSGANQAKVALTSSSAGTCTFTEGGSASNTLATVVQPVIDQANQAIAKAQTALTDLRQLQTQVARAQSDIDLQKAAADLQTLMTGGVLPSANEMAYAAAQSLSNAGTTGTAPTLAGEMNNIVSEANACISH